jgi:hypothetical protein
VHHERDASVEFVEAQRFAECILAGLLGEVTRQLPANYAKQVEIFPVEPACEGRARENDDADQPLIMNQRNERPRCVFLDQPGRMGLRGNALDTLAS